MNLNRTATFTFLIVAVVAAVWFLSVVGSGNRQTTSGGVTKTTGAEDRGAVLRAEIERLQSRHLPNVPPRQPPRNLFQYFGQHAAARSAPAVKPAAAEAPPAPVVPPAPLKLVGIAEDAGDNGPVRTAIISGFGQLFLVKEGEAVTLRYRVVKISDTVVELSDATADATVRLALK